MSAVECDAQTIWIADAYRGDGKRFIVHAEEKLTAFVQLQRAIDEFAMSLILQWPRAGTGADDGATTPSTQDSVPPDHGPTDASAGKNAQVRLSGKRSADAGIAAGPNAFISNTFYHPSADNPERWGDYSAVTTDPLNANNAWLVNEKINSGGLL